MLQLEKARGLSAAAREGECGWNQKPVEGGKKNEGRGGGTRNPITGKSLSFLSGSDSWSDHFFMCVFPKVIIIMFMGGDDPPKNFALRVNTELRSTRYKYRFYISPPPP